ncbi:MAG: nucleoside deaminase [Phycisphaeraceae bacterium]|nr:nucleoside deaminase [Phycisphaeraceae bacterium]
MQTHFEFELPAWVEPFVAGYDPDFSTPDKRMALAIALSAENIKKQTGGPFGAAIFDSNHQLIAPGVNLVPSKNCSILHAEMVAIALAQQALGRYDLSDAGQETYELAASTEPCAMCFGAVPWSGVKRLLCGARDEDARAVGFDEGAKLSEWPEALQERGIDVVRDIARADAVAVLNDYAKQQGTIY